jgi:hypothetical protein
MESRMERLRDRARTWSSSMTSAATGSSASAAAAVAAAATASLSPASSASSASPERNSLGRQRDRLERQIRDRDARIGPLEHDLRRAQASLAAARRGLDDVRLRQLEHGRMHRIAEDRHARQGRAARQRLRALTSDLDDPDSLAGYAELIQEAAAKAAATAAKAGSTYGLRLQTQIRRADGRRVLQAEEMERIRRDHEAVMDGLMAEAADAVRERCRAEIDAAHQIKQLRREMGLGEQGLRDELDELERKVGRARRLLERLEKEGLEGGADGDGSDAKCPSNGGTADDVEDASGNGSHKTASNGTETIPEEEGEEEVGEDEHEHEEESTSEEIKLAKLKDLREQLKALQLDSARAEEKLRATLKAKRNEIDKLIGGRN